MNLILASTSPRRKEILKREGFDFKLVPSKFNEENISDNPILTAVNNATGKAREVFNNLHDSSAVVLGADTIVVFKGNIIGKPKNKEDAVQTLKILSGRTHFVITGYAIVHKNGTMNGHAVNEVTFNVLSDALITEYVNTGKPMDKAGSYGIQDGYINVKTYTGDYDNIMGLPISQIKNDLSLISDITQ